MGEDADVDTYVAGHGESDMGWAGLDPDVLSGRCLISIVSNETLLLQIPVGLEPAYEHIRLAQREIHQIGPVKPNP